MSADFAAHHELKRARAGGWQDTACASNGDDFSDVTSVPGNILDALNRVEHFARRAAMHRMAGSRMPHFARVL